MRFRIDRLHNDTELLNRMNVERSLTACHASKRITRGLGLTDCTFTLDLTVK